MPFSKGHFRLSVAPIGQKHACSKAGSNAARILNSTRIGFSCHCVNDSKLLEHDQTEVSASCEKLWIWGAQSLKSTSMNTHTHTHIHTPTHINFPSRTIESSSQDMHNIQCGIFVPEAIVMGWACIVGQPTYEVVNFKGVWIIFKPLTGKSLLSPANTTLLTSMK
jgi:hypothetical protein